MSFCNLNLLSAHLLISDYSMKSAGRETDRETPKINLGFGASLSLFIWKKDLPPNLPCETYLHFHPLQSFTSSCYKSCSGFADDSQASDSQRFSHRSRMNTCHLRRGVRVTVSSNSHTSCTSGCFHANGERPTELSVISCRCHHPACSL